MAEDTGTPTALEGSSLPTKVGQLRAISWGPGYDLANTFFVQLTFFGSVFILFLNNLGLYKSQIGSLLSVMPYLSLLSLFITRSVAKTGYRKTFLLSIALRKFAEKRRYPILLPTNPG